jgi:hypothetical protein
MAARGRAARAGSYIPKVADVEEEAMVEQIWKVQQEAHHLDNLVHGMVAAVEEEEPLVHQEARDIRV